tara:strand:+ start:2413 stop:2991 length:579 start_codon:yes stop_codon:yes gene_type:complete
MNIVVAACKNRGIGFKNNLPWKISKEMKYFKELTIGEENNAVVMGRNTWLSIPEKNRPLPKRENIVLTSRTVQTRPWVEGEVNFINSLDSITSIYGPYTFDNIWIIGGEKVYTEALKNDMVDSIFYTEIQAEFECDTFFQEIPNNFLNIYESKSIYDSGERIKFKVFRRRNSSYTPASLRNMAIRAEKKALL